MTFFRCLDVRLLIAIACAAGCTDFRSISAGECGNGVIDPFEDCDSNDERCVACSVTCVFENAAQTCESYGEGMEGFVCGVDNLCHAGTGEFRTPTERGTAVETFRVTDIDKDGIGDLLLQTSTSVDVLHGNREGDLATRTSLQSPIARGNAAYADIDDDRALDLMIPTTDGIVAYTSSYGALTPLPFASTIPPLLGTPRVIRTVADDHLVIVGERGPRLALIVLDIRQVPPFQRIDTDLCGAMPSEIDDKNVSIAETPNGDVVVAATIDRALSQLCVVRLDRDSSTPSSQWQAATLPSAMGTKPPRSRPLVGGLPTACPSVFVTTVDGLVELKGTGTADACTLQPVSPAFPDTTIASIPIAAFTVEHPLPQEPRLGLVMVGRIGELVGNTLVPMDMNDRILDTAASADFDGDGLTDLVLGNTGQHDFDILYRLPVVPMGSPTQFRPYRLATAGPVERLLVGDFDGNLRPDIAYVQTAVGAQEIAISYGTADVFLPGAVVGSYGSVLSLLRGNIGDSNDPSAQIVDDLAVMFSNDVDMSTLQLVLLHGSPQRTMLSFFDPRSRDAGGPDPTSNYRGVVAGRFRIPESSQELAPVEVVAVESYVENGSKVKLWLSSDLGGGEVVTAPSRVAPQLATCMLGMTGSMCVEETGWIAWPLGGARTGLDAMIGIDRFGRAGTFDPTTIDQEGETIEATLWNASLPVPEDTSPRVRSLSMFEAGEDRRLVVARGNRGGGGAVHLCKLDDGAVPSEQCLDLATEIETATGLADLQCVDAAVGRTAAAGRFVSPASAQLHVLCHAAESLDDPGPDRPDGIRGIFRIGLVNGALVIEPFRLLAETHSEIGVGDVSGDGLDDLVLVDRSSTLPTVRVLVQCTSRDRDCGADGIVEAGMR